MWETWVQSLGQEDLLEKGMATHSSILASPPTQKGGSKEYLGFPGGSEVKVSASNVGDPGWIPGSGRSPEERNSHPHQYSGLENSMDGNSMSIFKQIFFLHKNQLSLEGNISKC